MTDALQQARDALVQMIACHEEPTCPAIAIAEAAIAAIDAAQAKQTEPLNQDHVACDDGSEGGARLTLTRWVMHDNHMFTKLSANDGEALAKAIECFDEDGGYLMLCGTWSDETTGTRMERGRPRPVVMHAGGRNRRTAFIDAATVWLAAHPSSHAKTSRPHDPESSDAALAAPPQAAQPDPQR